MKVVITYKILGFEAEEWFCKLLILLLLLLFIYKKKR